MMIFQNDLKPLITKLLFFYNVDGVDFSSQTFNEFLKRIKNFIENIPSKKVTLKQKMKFYKTTI